MWELEEKQEAFDRTRKKNGVCGSKGVINTISSQLMCSWVSMQKEDQDSLSEKWRGGDRKMWGRGVGAHWGKDGSKATSRNGGQGSRGKMLWGLDEGNVPVSCHGWDRETKGESEKTSTETRKTWGGGGSPVFGMRKRGWGSDFSVYEDGCVVGSAEEGGESEKHRGSSTPLSRLLPVGKEHTFSSVPPILGRANEKSACSSPQTM